MERAGSQAFERGLRKRPQRQELFRVLLNGDVVLAGHANGDQVDQAFFGLRALRQDLTVNCCRLVKLPQELERNGFAE